MAQTTAAVQAQLGASNMNATIVASKEFDYNGGDTTHQQWYVIGNVDAPGRQRWITTLSSDSAATQATNMLTSLRST